MKVKILSDCVYGKKGSIADVPDKEAEILENAGIVAEKIEKPEASEDDIDEFLKSSGSFLNADAVEEGDTIEIVSKGHIDRETFDSDYIVIPVKHKNNECNLRIGPKNAKRIANSFGTTKLSEWVGRKLEVIGIETYKGLGTKGMLLRGYKQRADQ